VRAAISGAQPLNTLFFANVQRRVRDRAEYLPVTISLAVYTESNEVIFATIKRAQRAVAEYRRVTGRPANLVVSDDGLGKWLGGSVTAQAIAQAEGPAAERLAFYRRERISFVARPMAGRRGKFKKASNLNYTNDVAWLRRRGAAGSDLADLFGPGGPFEGGYAEGDIVIHDLICVLDKDSGMEPGVLAATTPEFAADPELGFTQHMTAASNPDENYFTWLQARFTAMIYRVALTNKALQGLQVHLMGHSLFVRRGFLEAIGGWPEDRVSEDYATALDGYDNGWHGKLIAFPGLDFTEQVCASFTEETGKQSRYCYGMGEVTLTRHRHLPWPMKIDLVIHYFSYLNLAAALPLVLLLLSLHQMYYLFAGLLANLVIFMVVPVVQGWLLAPTLGFTGPAQVMRFFVLNALTFVGHAYSMLSGLTAFALDKARGRYEPFKATSVDQIEHSFAAGVRLLRSYGRQNLPALAIYLCIGLGCVSVLTDQPPHLIRPLLALFVLAHAIAPIALTPQLFARPRFLTAGALHWRRPSRASRSTPAIVRDRPKLWRSPGRGPAWLSSRPMPLPAFARRSARGRVTRAPRHSRPFQKSQLLKADLVPVPEPRTGTPRPARSRSARGFGKDA
jgi:hypothetical protein